MQLPRPYSMQSKFLLGLSIATFIIGGLLAIGFYIHVSSFLNEEVRQKAALVLAQVDAIQQYVRQTLRPAMYERYPRNFVIEAMSSSYISRKVMDNAVDNPNSTVYRRVAIDARNAGYEANLMEHSLIDYFREHPEQKLWQGYKTIDGENYYVMARPARFTKSCMYCHGRQQDAPAELVQKYGSRGFGHKLNSIDGLDFVGMPVTASVARLQDTLLTYLIFFTVAAFLFFAATNLIFRRVVVNNMRTLIGAFRRNLSDTQSDELIRSFEHVDEIDEMTEGMERLGEHLLQTRAQLEDYAQNLEARVADRTEDLARESRERQEDVRLFVRMLAGLNQSQTMGQLWRHALPLIGRRFDLERVVYVCSMSSFRQFSWPDSEQPIELPEDWMDLLTDPQARIGDNSALIPVESTEGGTEGFLCLYRKEGDVFRQQDHELLLAVGRQLGIAAENISALDDILRHTENLQFIFEGIADPLLLLNPQGSAVIINEAARRLTTDLFGEKKDESDRNLFLLLCKEQVTNPNCDLGRALERGRQVEQEVLLPSGRSIMIRLFPVGGESGRIIAHLREITHEKLMLAQAAQSEKMITVGRLASGLAHEINNPLGVILCYAELLRQTAQDPQQKKDIEVIVRHTKQAQVVLRELLNFARPKISTSERINIGNVAASVGKVFVVQAGKKGVQLQSEVEPDLPLVRVENQVVEHIVANLILNALDAVEQDKGLIFMKAAYDKRKSQVVLTVRDNGRGIAPEALPHIFDPFFTTKEVSKGTGLGLAVVYGYMQDLGGSVSAANTGEGGALFTLRFPVAEDKAEEAS